MARHLRGDGYIAPYTQTKNFAVGADGPGQSLLAYGQFTFCTHRPANRKRPADGGAFCT